MALVNSMLDERSIASLHIPVMKRDYIPDGIPKATKEKEGADLKRLWDLTHKVSQSKFATDVLGLSSGYLPQFFKGDRPLTLKIAREFAKHLQCNISDFSQRLAKEQASEGAKVTWPFPEVVYEEVKNLEEWDLLELQGKIRSFLLKKRASASTQRGRPAVKEKSRNRSSERHGRVSNS